MPRSWRARVARTIVSLVVVTAGGACKGDKRAATSGGTAAGSGSGSAGSGTAGSDAASGGAGSSDDAGGVAAAAPDAAIDPGPDAAPIAAPADGFWLVDEASTAGSVLLLRDLGAGEVTSAQGPGTAALVEATGTFRVSHVVATRTLAAPPADLAALIGAQVTLHGASGRGCAATIEGIVAVRTIERAGADGEVVAALQSRRSAPAEPMWSAPTMPWERSYAVASLGDNRCSDSLFATAVGVEPARTRIAAADPWKDAARDRFLATELAEGISSAIDLGDDTRERPRFVSVRRLGPADAPALALLYGTIDGDRTIVVMTTTGDGLDGASEAVAVFAESPSTVTGVDVDRDGRPDAIIGHPDGVALVYARDGSYTMSDGGVVTGSLPPPP